MKNASLLLALGVTLFALAACDSQKSTVGAEAESKPLIVGMELSYRPFEMTDASGKPSGIGVEMAEALGVYLKRPVEIRNLPFDGLIPELRTGRIDVIISSMTANDERRKTIDFSDPYVSTGICLLANKDSPVQDAASLDQPGRTVAVKQATTGHLYARDHFKQAKVVVLDQEESCVLEVVQGKADAFIYDQMSVYQHWKRNPETTRAILAPIQRETWAAGLAKGNEELRGKINEFLKVYRAGGGFDRLAEKYLSEEKKEFRDLGQEFIF